MRLRYKWKRKQLLEMWKHQKSLKQRMSDMTDYFIREIDKIREQMATEDYYKGFGELSEDAGKIINTVKENNKKK